MGWAELGCGGSCARDKSWHNFITSLVSSQFTRCVATIIVDLGCEERGFVTNHMLRTLSGNVTIHACKKLFAWLTGVCVCVIPFFATRQMACCLRRFYLSIGLCVCAYIALGKSESLKSFVFSLLTLAQRVGCMPQARVLILAVGIGAALSNFKKIELRD